MYIDEWKNYCKQAGEEALEKEMELDRYGAHVPDWVKASWEREKRNNYESREERLARTCQWDSQFDGNDDQSKALQGLTLQGFFVSICVYIVNSKYFQ